MQISFHLHTTTVQQMQNNSKLELHHGKKGREDGKGKGKQESKQPVSVRTV
jgi:hypothetical protein